MVKSRLHNPILIIAPETDHVIRVALREAGINRPLLSLSEPASLDHYLDGHGLYADRTKFPLPDLIIQDATLPPLPNQTTTQPWLATPISTRQIVITDLTGQLEPWQFESATALAPNTILCQLPSDNSLRALFQVLQHACFPPSKKIHLSPLLPPNPLAVFG